MPHLAARSSNGRTAGSEPASLGSNPSLAILPRADFRRGKLASGAPHLTREGPHALERREPCRRAGPQGLEGSCIGPARPVRVARSLELAAQRLEALGCRGPRVTPEASAEGDRILPLDPDRLEGRGEAGTSAIVRDGRAAGE